MKKVLCLLLSLMLLASFAACGGQADPPTSQPASQAASQAASQSTADSDADAAPDGPQQGGKFTFAMFYVTPTFFTPAAAFGGSVKMFVTPSLEPVARENKDGTIEPFLAESMESDPDALTFTIKLREGITFHDGSELNAEVLKWNLDYIIENGNANGLGNPTGVEALDDYTVQLQYDTWSVSWASYMCSVLVYSKQAYDDNGEEWCAVNMIGTGPFVMDSYAVDDKIVWSRNENYWQEGLPYLDSMELHWIYDTNTSASAFMNGEIDNFDTSVSTAISMMLDSGYETSADNLTANCTFGFTLPNSANPDSPLNNVEVRKALLSGVDWNGVAAAATGGYGYWSNQIGGEDAYNYDASLQNTAYDVETAKQMLADAGYPDGFETTVYTITNNATNEAAATAIQAELGKVGITAELELVDTSVITEMRTTNTNWDGLIVLGAPLSKDMTSTFNNNYSPNGSMHSQIIDFPDEYLEALEKANSAATMEERIEQLKICARIIAFDNVLMIPTFYMPKYQFTQDYVHDTNMNAVNAFQWTPELIWLSK